MLKFLLKKVKYIYKLNVLIKRMKINKFLKEEKKVKKKNHTKALRNFTFCIENVLLFTKSINKLLKMIKIYQK